MFDLIDTAITGDQFLLALHDTLIMVAVSLGFGALIGVPLGDCAGGLPSRRHRGQPGGASGAESAD
ncbi:hypothetical protein LNO89_03530 [Klebsiella pneumoniae subsp. pneumoniae]|nr:hypothetical protein [Klebsiella pneumoniae subsp. pneumoniae]